MSQVCNICYNTKPRSDFSTLGSHCKADTCTSCKSCQFRVVKTAFQTNGHKPSINCVYCKSPLEYSEIETILEYGWQNHADDLLIKFQLTVFEEEPGFIMCAHKCGSGGYHDGESNIVFCDGCGKSTCVQHRIPFHHGLTCEEFDEEQIQNDTISQIIISKLAKQCPKCSAWIQKQDVQDCDHMRCICKHEFCFQCYANYDTIRKHGNHHHDSNCTFYFAYAPK